MMIPIPAARQRLSIELKVLAQKNVLLGIIVYDPGHLNTDYFRRKLFLQKGEQRKIHIRMPISPDRCLLEIFDKETTNQSGFKVMDFKVNRLPFSEIWTSPERQRFMDFAIEFAKKAGHISPGFYDSKDHEFLIQYLPQITDRWGKVSQTPARINRKMPRIQVSASQFRKYSIPVRVFILAHEGCHYFLNTRSQKTADLCGLKQYLDYGFPRIEAIYATTQIFAENPGLVNALQIRRTKDILDYINQYTKRKAA